MPLEHEDQQHLQAAQGYIELGMWLDANEELEKIDPENRHLPEVLAVRHEIYRGLKKWDLMQTVSKRLAEHDPENVQWWISWASATRELGDIDRAGLVLIAALKHVRDKGMICYKLACYQCEIGDLTLATGYLAQAFKSDPKLRIKALDDEDLMPLWLVIEED